MAKDPGNPADHSKETAFIVAWILLCVGSFLLWKYANFVVVVPAFFVYFLEYRALQFVHLLSFGDNNAGWVAATLFNHDICQPRCVPSAVDWPNFVAISKDVGQRTYMMNIAILFAMAMVILFRMRGDGFKRTFSLTGRSRKSIFRFLGIKIKNRFLIGVIKTLTFLTLTKKLLTTEKKEWVNVGPSFMRYQSDYWAISSPAESFNADNFSGPEHPARTPAEWLRDHHVSLTEKAGLDEAAARLAFEAQLGQAWTGLKNASYYVKTIATLSALGRKREPRRDTLAGEIARIHALGGADVEKKCLELLNKWLSDKTFTATLERVMGKHAYTNTAMIAILGWGGPLKNWGGGKSGIFASSSFLWLRSVDRPLWYALNNVGRRAFHTEGAGVVSHFFAERLARQPLLEPYVESAMDGLRRYLKEHLVLDLDKYFYEEKDF